MGDGEYLGYVAEDRAQSAEWRHLIRSVHACYVSPTTYHVIREQHSVAMRHERAVNTRAAGPRPHTSPDWGIIRAYLQYSKTHTYLARGARGVMPNPRESLAFIL